MQVTRQEIDTGWRVREIASPTTPEHNRLPWLPATVPGHVHLDLMRAGVIPDPFARLHERDVAWVSESDWQYETTFTVVDPVPAHAYLLFHGLDTVAEIELNGEPLGKTDNMYIPHEFPVDGKLKAGENHLSITFRSPLRVGRERMEAWGDPALMTDPFPGNWDRWAERSFVRKAQYMYGWDWGPVLPSCGLWRPVELVTVPVAHILDWKYHVEFTKDGKAIITVEAEVERMPGADGRFLEFRAELAPDHRSVYSMNATHPWVNVSVPSGKGRHTVTATLTQDTPRLWWPNGCANHELHASSHLYTLALFAITDGKKPFADKKEAKIALRTIELIRDPDGDGTGEGFKFRINGTDIFVKGANWIPEDAFPSRLENRALVRYRDDTRVADRIDAACNAGFNMLRVWGGGLYESEHFYELCDAHGILVWQDFPYACAYYPDTGEYAEAARAEAAAAVKRIRNHPSLALWCGNNENQTMYHDGWGGERPARFLGEKLYFDILPGVVAAEDPNTPYWPSSPYGGENPNSADYGDCHNWDVWHGRGDWKHYTENDSRFCSEFGFASSCGLGAWDKCLAPEDRHPHSPAVRWHDKTRKGYDTYLGYIGLHYPDPQTLEDLVYYSQINQAEALKYGIEHYRRRKGRCWGTLFWQINDCWPVQSWAIIDSEGEPKAAYYWAKKFYAPILLSLLRQEDHAEAHLVSDLLTSVAGELTFALETFEGEVLATQTAQVSVGENSAAMATLFALPDIQGREQEVYVYAIFTPRDGQSPVENLLLLAEPKDLRLASPGLTFAIAENDGSFTITLTATRFAPYVWLRRADNQPLYTGTDTGDNFFHLRAGQTRRIAVPKSDGAETLKELRGQLVVRTL